MPDHERILPLPSFLLDDDLLLACWRKASSILEEANKHPDTWPPDSIARVQLFADACREQMRWRGAEFSVTPDGNFTANLPTDH